MHRKTSSHLHICDSTKAAHTGQQGHTALVVHVWGWGGVGGAPLLYPPTRHLLGLEVQTVLFLSKDLTLCPGCVQPPPYIPQAVSSPLLTSPRLCPAPSSHPPCCVQPPPHIPQAVSSPLLTSPRWCM
jgi:hypothetical protein